jgi:uncharacterized repeat protein (TIGR03803 family)
MNQNLYLKNTISYFSTIKTNVLLRFCIITLVLISNSLLQAQSYIHPNQAGRLGGDTSNAATGSQVITSTYYGNAGNTLGQGVIFSVNKDGTNAASFHDFDGYPGDGSYPFYTTPHQGSDGKLYGNSYVGGAWNWGAIYHYDFSNCSEYIVSNNGPGDTSQAASPGNYGNINELSDGKIYAVQTYGGKYNYGGVTRMNKDGTNFEIIHSFSYTVDLDTTLAIGYVPYTAAAQAQTVISAINYPDYDVAHPYGFITEGADGKVYGTCYDGGAWSNGGVYRMDKDGSNYEVINVGYNVYRVLHYKDGNNVTLFNALNLTYPWGNVTQDRQGRIYMVSLFGGVNNLGGVARMDANGGNYQILHSGVAADGYYPIRGVIAIDNNIYGTYRNGGAGGYGTIFKINTATSAFTNMYSFPITLAEGGNPWAGLSYDGTHLFGTTILGGGAGKVGTIFKIKPDGTGFQTIHRFSNSSSTSVCPGGKFGLFAYYPSAERVTFGNVNLSCSKTCIENAAPCMAATTPPVLLGTTSSNSCPATTVNLNLLSAGNAGIVTWHTDDTATVANKVVDATKVPAGMYYATFYDAVNDCYSATASAAVTVNINTCYTTLSVSGMAFNFTTPMDSAKTGSVALDANPIGEPAISFMATDCATNLAIANTEKGGSITINASTGAYVYTPPIGYIGFDNFCVKICDGKLPMPNCKNVKYTITVTPAPCNAAGTVPQN